MSDHRSKSPPRVKISPGIDGLPPHRLLVSPGMEAELQRVSPHSMLLAQLTASEGLHRTPGAASPSSVSLCKFHRYLPINIFHVHRIIFAINVVKINVGTKQIYELN